MMSSLEIDVDSEYETPKERVHSFLQVRFNVLPRVRFASIMNQKDYWAKTVKN